MTHYIEVSGDNGKNTSEILNIKHEIIIVKMYESISLWTVSGQDSWGAVRPSWVAEYPRQCKLRCKVSPGPGPAYPAPSGNLPMLSILYPTLPPSAQLMCINKHRKQNRCILTIWGSNNVSVYNVGIFYPSNTMQMRGTQWRWTMWDTASFVFSNKGQMCHNLKLWYTTFSI